MPDIARTEYKLFALPLNAETIEIASQERFSRATPTPAPGYVLVYTADKQPAGAEEITKDRVKLLSEADERWLLDSNAALIAEDAQKREKEIVQSISERLENLQNALKQAKAEFEKKGD